MAGGHATQKGIRFQNEVAAWVATHIIAEKPLTAISDDNHVIPVSFVLEAITPVDDIVVKTSNGGHLYINVKTKLSASREIKSELSNVIGQFVRQWIYRASSSNPDTTKYDFNDRLDRLALVLNSAENTEFRTSLNTVLQRIRDRRSILPTNEIATTARQLELFESCKFLVAHHWKQQVGEELPDGTLLSLLSAIRVVGFSLEGTTKQSLEILISDAITKSAPGSVLEALLDIVAELSEKRSGTDAAGLRERLRNKKIIVADEGKFKVDLERLFQYTNATLSTLDHYGSIQTTNNSGESDHIIIDRTCTHALIEAAKVNSFLLIGDPGAGKSGSLHQAAKTLTQDKYSVIVLAVDQLRAGSLSELKQELELNHPILDVLASHHPDNAPLLFIDALDASRGGPSERAILDLINGLKQKGPQWNVIASIRKFDLRFGNNYQNLFIGKPVNDQFMDSEFQSVNHLNIPNLTNIEINWICNRWERLMSIYSTAGEQFRALLRSPFNLHLLSKVFSTSSNEDLGHAKTQLELLQKYWQHWVIGNSATEGKKHMRVLSLLMDSMVKEHRLYSDESLIDTALIEDLNLLLSKGVLYQSTGATRITFSHHMLFDFALAKIKLLNEGGVNLLKELTTSDDDTLLIAPASMLALRVIWDEDSQRNHFWDIAFKLATAKDFGAFSRSLPARIIAEATTQLSDVARLIEGMRSDDEDIREAALFLTRHIYGVLISRVIKNIPNLDNPSDPWAEITQQICESSIALAVWPMKAVVADWTGKGRTFSTNHLNSLGKCSRLLLDQCLLMEHYDDGAISAAISGVIATFESDVRESEQVLGRLLVPERVAQYGHRELFWFALGFDAIANFSPSLSANLLLCVYTTPLPSRDEKTSLSNSQILGLTSNKRQDFEGVRYQLEDKISLFLLKHKQEASAAVKQILWDLGEEDKKEKIEANKVILRQSEFVMYTDYNTIWWKEEKHEYDTRGTLLTQLLKALTQPSIESSGADLLKYANYFLTGKIHTGIVAVFLKALERTQYLECFDLVTDLLSSLSILTNLDTYYLAGTLISKYYPVLSVQARESIEHTIKLIPDERSRSVVIGCLIPNLIVDFSLAETHQELTDQNKIIPNSPPFKMETSWGSSDGNWWLKHEGVDVEGPIEKSILEAISAVNSKNADSNDISELDSNAERWDKVQHLAYLLESNPGAHKQLQNQGLDTLGEACGKAAEHCNSNSDLSRFPEIRRYISSCLLPHLTPLAVLDVAAEKNFEQSASWGRPAPRIEAAEALMVYLRAEKTVSEQEYDLVLRLARDPAVAVRHAILARSNVVSVASPQLSRALAEIAFGEEQNLGVVKFFLGSFQNYLNQDLAWASQMLLELDRRMESQDDTKGDELSSQLVSLILHLWLVWNDDNAEDRLYVWAESSIEYAGRIGHLLVDLREFIVFGNLEEKIKREEIIREKTSKLFNKIVLNLSESHDVLREKVIKENQSDPYYETSIRQLHNAANQLYFGSGAYGHSNESSKLSRPAAGRRFLKDYGAALNNLARIPHPSVTHPVLETLQEFIQIDPIHTLELLFETLQVGGRKGQYAFESMGADLVVRLVQRFLADYTSLIANNLEYRKSLVEILDQFAEVGWPEARKLVYNLPEMLR